MDPKTSSIVSDILCKQAANDMVQVVDALDKLHGEMERVVWQIIVVGESLAQALDSVMNEQDAGANVRNATDYLRNLIRYR